MNTPQTELSSPRVTVSARRPRSPWRWWLCAGLLAGLTSLRLAAQTTTIYSEDWESYTSYAATSLNDTAYAFPAAAGPALIIAPPPARGNNPAGGVPGSGLQLINWLHHSGNQCLLVRSGCEADINLYNTRSGTRYQLDFWLYMHKHGPINAYGTNAFGVRNFYIRPGGQGVNNNGDDYIAYRSDRAASFKVFNYNGISTAAGAWSDTGKTTLEDTWQHHRLVVDTASRVVNIYIDNMSAPFASFTARPDVAVPTILRLQHEGTTADDGWYAIDDITLTVDNAISLDTPFTDSFESYPVGQSTNMNGPWITVACNGTSTGKALNPSKVQVVDGGTLAPHTGSKCLMVQGGERGGVALAWGIPPKRDVKITWWANVSSATYAGLSDVKLNMCLYNTVGGNTYGASTLGGELGYGLAYQSSKYVGSPNSLLAGATATAWADTAQTFTSDTWEEYQLTTYNREGAYTIVKNPSSPNPVIVVTNATFITVGSSSGPTFMASWASATALGGPAYIDDVRVESVTNAPYGPPPPQPSGPYAAAVLSNNPAAYYSCQDAPGSFLLWDSSANAGHNGRWVYDVTRTYPMFGQSGIDGNSVLFHPYTNSSSSPWAVAGNYADLNPSGPFAVEAWVRPISIGTGFRSPLASFAGTNGWLIYQSPQGGGTFQWVWVQKNGNIWITSGLGTANQWYHLAATFDGTNTSFYVNGQFQGQADASTATPNTINPLTIGAHNSSGGGAFDGNVCQVAIYTNALAANTILTHYQVGSTNIQNLPNPPTITTQPASASAYAGTPVSFQVVAQGYTPLHYQWYRNGSPMPGATADTLLFTSDYYVDSDASYHVVVTNLYGSVPSSSAMLTLSTALNLNSSPASITRTVGSKAAFLAVGGGAQPIGYQWYRGTAPDSVLIPSATNQTLWLDNVQLSDATNYYATLSNPWTSQTTAPATLTVVPRTNTVPLTQYAAYIAADDPVAYWRLDQPDTNSPAVGAIGSFDGRYVATNGALFTFGVPTGIPYETNVAVGVSNKARVIVPYALELNPAGPFTAEAWVQPASVAANGEDWRCPFSSLNPTGPTGWNYYQGPDNLWRVLLWGGGGLNYSLIDTNDVIVPNNWYHLVLSYDGSLFKMYVNGALRASAAYSGYARNSNGPSAFGWRSDSQWLSFLGTIDDVAFYNKALTPERIQLHYAGGLRLTINKLDNDKIVLSWPMGTLQQASTLNGTYTDVTGATSPYTNSITPGTKFFRVKADSN